MKKDAIRALLCLARPRTCIVSFLAYALGVNLSLPGWPPIAIVGAGVSLLVPAAANLHNAVTDLPEDQLNLPGRVALVQSVGSQTIMLVVKIMAVVMAAAALFANIAIIFLVLTGLALLHAYSAGPIRAKARPVAGLAVFSMVVSFPFLGGALLTEGWLVVPRPDIWLVATIFGYLTFWFCAKGFVKNVPDYHGDKAAGLRTSATVCASLQAAARRAAIATIVAYASVPLLVFIGGAPQTVLLALFWLAPAAANVWTLVSESRPERLNNVLGRDMLISVGFLATILNLMLPGIASLVIAAVALVLLAASDALQVDSRRVADLNTETGA